MLEATQQIKISVANKNSAVEINSYYNIKEVEQNSFTFKYSLNKKRRTIMKKLLSVVLAVVVAASLAACGGSKQAEAPAASSDEVFELKLAGSMPVDAPSSLGMEEVKRICEEKSNGRLKITTYPANQLGDATNVFEDIMAGNVDMGCFFTSNSYDVRLAVNSLPYLVTNAEEAKKVYSPGSHYFKAYGDLFTPLNVKLLGIHGDGFVGLLYTKMPEGYKDVLAKKTLMMRMAATDAYRIALEQMNYPTVTISFSDLYTALQTGVCDGAIGLTPVSAEASFAELIKYWVPQRIFIDPLDYVISLDTWNKLPADLQTILQDAVTEVTNKQFDNMDALDQAALDKLVAGGTEILPLSDDEFAAYVKKVREDGWAEMAELVGQEIIDEIKKDIQ